MEKQKSANKIFVDFEMNPVESVLAKDKYFARDEIIQFGAVVINDDGVEIGSFSSYVKPLFATRMDRAVEKLTGIRFCDLAEAPAFENVLSAFIEWCKSYIEYEIFAWSDSDLNQIQKEITNKLPGVSEDCQYMLEHWNDFQKEYGQLLGMERCLSLKNSLEYMGLEPEGRLHDALQDAHNTARLYVACRETDDNSQFNTIKRVLNGGDDTAVTLGDLFDLSKWKSKVTA